MKNRKIKSVTLAKTYRDIHCEMQKGYKLFQTTDGNWTIGVYTIDESLIVENKTGLFSIEFEDEHWEDVYRVDGIKQNARLNDLADWCEGKCEDVKDATYYLISYNNNPPALTYDNWEFTTLQGMKFKSYKSAGLFISELSRSENKELYNYFVELLRKDRL